jgi:hypothetical protein
VGAFFVAVLVWGMLACVLLAEPDVTSGSLLLIPLLASLALFAGVFLGFQGVGRASAGATGMGYAVAGLLLLLGPWAAAFVLMIAFAILALFGAGPIG